MAGDDGGRMDESTTPDLGHERRVIAAIVVAVVALAVLGAVVLRAKPEAPAVAAPVAEPAAPAPSQQWVPSDDDLDVPDFLK